MQLYYSRGMEMLEKKWEIGMKRKWKHMNFVFVTDEMNEDVSRKENINKSRTLAGIT